jgi:hydroxymethylglutaryl-CoA reductase
MKTIEGFSKLTKQQKIDWIAQTYFSNNSAEILDLIQKYWNSDAQLQKLHDEFIENTITNFYLPLGVAPNFIINGKNITIPMVIEESSVVAAASKAAKYWSTRGGFKAEVLSTEKIGQIHFIYKGDISKLEAFITENKTSFWSITEDLTHNMQLRGGGILDVVLRNKTHELEGYYQLHVTFETKDSMGANFINSCLERMAQHLKELISNSTQFSESEKDVQIIMSILSNYVPNCVVRASVSCPVSELKENQYLSSEQYAQKFITAIKIAEIEPHRAVTHNKGIMNGVDAVVIATGNDFRAVEAGVHAYAAKNGQYSSLSHAKIENGIFHFWLDIPLALGTVGGLTSLHPMVKFCLGLLEKPNAKQLMEVIAVAGLAQNFAALNSLITTGIQKGHMKMHLMNMLNQLSASDEEKSKAILHFKKETITHHAVEEYINSIRNLV